MEITYELKPEDFIEYWKKNHSKFIFSPYIFLCAIALAFIPRLWGGASEIITTDYDGTKTVTFANFLVEIAIYSVIFIGICFLLRLRYVLYFKKTIRQNPGILGKKKLELLNDKIISSTHNSKSEYLISKFKEIVEAPDYFYLFSKIDKNVYFIIPKRDLIDDGFITRLKAEMKNGS